MESHVAASWRAIARVIEISYSCISEDNPSVYMQIVLYTTAASFESGVLPDQADDFLER